MLLLPVALCLAQEDTAGTNELASGFGGIPALAQIDSPSLNLGSGVAFHVNYERRFLNDNRKAPHGEITFVVSTLRNAPSSVSKATSDSASLYSAPGMGVKFRPASRVSPCVALGGGYGDYEQSLTRIDGRPDQAPRELAHGVFDFGAGVDIHVWRFVAVRSETHDFCMDSPNSNIPSISGGQHNVVAAGTSSRGGIKEWTW